VVSIEPESFQLEPGEQAPLFVAQQVGFVFGAAQFDADLAFLGHDSSTRSRRDVADSIAGVAVVHGAALATLIAKSIGHRFLRDRLVKAMTTLEVRPHLGCRTRADPHEHGQGRVAQTGVMNAVVVVGD